MPSGLDRRLGGGPHMDNGRPGDVAPARAEAALALHRGRNDGRAAPVCSRAIIPQRDTVRFLLSPSHSHSPTAALRNVLSAPAALSPHRGDGAARFSFPTLLPRSGTPPGALLSALALELQGLSFSLRLDTPASALLSTGSFFARSLAHVMRPRCSPHHLQPCCRHAGLLERPPPPSASSSLALLLLRRSSAHVRSLPRKRAPSSSVRQRCSQQHS